MSGDRVTRMFDVLELLVGPSQGMTVTEISKRLDLPISSTHNMLQRMVSADLVVISDGPRYSIGGRLVRLGIKVVDGLEIRAVARRPLQELARTIEDDIYLAVRLGRRVVYVDRMQGSKTISVNIRLGQDLYLHATSVGKLYASYDPACWRRMVSSPLPKLTQHTLTTPEALEVACQQVVRDGYALSIEEAVLGIAGVAVPIFDSDHQLAAAIHVSSLAADFSPERTQQIVVAARHTATVVERALGR